MRYKTIDLTVEAGIATLTLNNPDNGNPIGSVFCREFGQVVNEIGTRGDVRAVLLQAMGRFFSVGGDIAMFAGDIDAAPATVLEGTFGLHMAMTRLLRLDAPLIACVHATAMGGAVAILSNCDLVYSARSARFGAAYAHLGFTCDLGATYGLASRMGIARARRFLLLGEMLDSGEALAAGLVDYVIDDDAVVERAREAAIKISQGPTQAYGEVRRLLTRALGNPFETQLEDEAQALSRSAGSADAREGISAFLEDRKPEFHGR
jgi:2-(1,2-epoxy-1,2-dihydrophenyl)acetyl-CoA isomerase